MSVQNIFRFKGLILPALLAVLLTTVYSACRKKDETCYVIVKVVRLDGTQVSGAAVKLTSNFANTSGNGELARYLPAVKITNSEGKAEFEFKLQAILDIEVTSGLGTGTSLVKLIPGETVSKTVVIQ